MNFIQILTYELYIIIQTILQKLYSIKVIQNIFYKCDTSNFGEEKTFELQDGPTGSHLLTLEASMCHRWHT